MSPLKSAAKNFIAWSLDILFPKYCLGCRRSDTYLCGECLAKIPTLKSVACFICGKRSPDARVCDECRQKNHPAVAGLLVASDWSDKLLRQIIYEYKYRFVKDLSRPLAALMINFLKQNIPALDLSFRARPEARNLARLSAKALAAAGMGAPFSSQTNQLINYPTDKLIIVPVPLHPRRRAWRGFNQAALLARIIGEHFKIPVVENILTRRRFTPPQMHIKDKNERQENINNAFCLNDGADSETIKKQITDQAKLDLKGKTVILIDDISTTGSTLQECARALKKLKPREIWGLVIARG